MRKILLLFLIFLLNISSFPQVETEAFLENANISGIDEEEDFIWVASYGQGIFQYSKKDGKWQNYSTKNGKLENDLFYCIAVSNNYVWAGSSEGLFIFDKKSKNWRKRKFALGGEFGNWIRALCYDKEDNVLWIGRFRNLTKLDVAKQRFTDYDITSNGDVKSNNITSIGVDNHNLVWFGTESGIHFYDKTKDINDKNAWTFINNKKGFNNEGESVSITDILFEGNFVWIGTAEFITQQQPEFNVGGIYRYNRRLTWDKISKRNGLPANGIYCLARTGNKLWAGIYSFDKKTKNAFGKGLVLIDRYSGVVTPIDLNQTEISSSAIKALHFDGDNMWVGTEKGLYKIKINNPLAEWSGKKETTEKTIRKNIN